MIENLIRFARLFEREWNKRFQLPPNKDSKKDEQSRSRKIMAKQPPQPELDPDEPILNQLEDLALAGDEEAQRQLNEIISSPERRKPRYHESVLSDDLRRRRPMIPPLPK